MIGLAIFVVILLVAAVLLIDWNKAKSDGYNPFDPNDDFF